MDQYERQFFGLRQYSSYRYDEVLIMQHFVRDLKDSTIGDVHLHQFRTPSLANEKARIIEINVARGFSARLGA